METVVGGMRGVINEIRFLRKCDKRGELFDTPPFANMCVDGELAYSSIEIYGDRYDLCPKCTWKIYKSIREGMKDV